MASNSDFHIDYDEGTEEKLEVLRQYLTAWLPVFVMTGHKEIRICDYFAGPGCDDRGKPGSPIVTLQIINKFRDKLTEKNVFIHHRLNEKVKKTVSKLRENTQNYISSQGLGGLVNTEITASDFDNIWKSEYVELTNNPMPSFMFLDQFGIKHITKEVFESLCSLDKSDFMFFISSSTLKRFCEIENVIKYHPDFPRDKIKECKNEHTHKIVCEYYQSLIPESNKSTFVFSFSIKKDGNVYGLIFCTKHPLGAEKFLKAAWKQDGNNGEANYDINDDIDGIQQNMFEVQRMSKKQEFSLEVESVINNNGSLSNKEAYLLSLRRGMDPSFCREVIKELKREGKIDGPGNFGMSYDTIYKSDKIVTFKAVKN